MDKEKHLKPASSKNSRYERMREILDEAAGDSSADYQGYGRFWNLPLEEFLQVELYGIPMIAPASSGVDTAAVVENTAEPDQPVFLNKLPCGPNSGGSSGGGSCCDPEPDTSSSCCGSKPKRVEGRGARSGLIIGLKGEFPFDGTHFPPLPWGGARVAKADILMISNWIDDGCPATDENQKEVEKKDYRARVTLGQQVTAKANRSTNTVRHENNGLKQRKNVEFLNDEEFCKWRYVHQEMMRLDAYPLDNRNYEYWARLHGNSCQHGWEQFLTWHRMFLYSFEQRCQDIIPEVTIPYWDWTMERYLDGALPKNSGKQKKYYPTFPKEVKKALPKEFLSGKAPKGYGCWLSKEAADFLVDQLGFPNKIKKLVDYYYDSGLEFFWALEQLSSIDLSKDLSLKEQIYKVLIEVNPLWTPYRYPANFYDENGKPLGIDGLEKTFHHHYPDTQEVEQILLTKNWIDFGGGPLYDQAYGVLDMNPHNTGHIWSGGMNPLHAAAVASLPPNASSQQQDFVNTIEPQFGVMFNNLTAGFDPIFWPHHSNVDRIYAEWQRSHPGQQPDDLSSPLSGLDYTVRDAMSIQRLGYEYVKSSHYFESDASIGMPRLFTEDAGVHDLVISNHRKAELVLHNVIQPGQSYSMRIFINQPDADIDTPVADNDHYAGYVSFFGHGDCIGGPGHCDPPAGLPRRFDRRPLHHNTPRNFKVDITGTVQRMVGKGHKDIQATIVVLAADRTKTPDHLRLDGLSINFHD